jgi:hypothetical protein
LLVIRFYFVFVNTFKKRLQQGIVQLRKASLVVFCKTIHIPASNRVMVFAIYFFTVVPHPQGIGHMNMKIVDFYCKKQSKKNLTEINVEPFVENKPYNGVKNGQCL